MDKPRTIAILFATTLALTLAACNGDDDVDAIEEPAEETGEAIEETGEAVGDAAEETGDALEDATD